ncbi:MAG: serine/threonine-protein kinase [Aureliella sp.]
MLDADQVQEVLRAANKIDDNQRLSATLQQLGTHDKALCKRIDAEGSSLAAALTRLSSGPQTADPPDAASAADADLPSEDFETLMEGSSQEGRSSDSGGSAFSSSHGKEDSQVPPGAKRYTKQRPHAQGGLGQVWVASDTELRRVVALKEVQPAYADDDDCRARFIREAEITGALQHPGIVPVYGLGRHTDGRPFYAMRFIEGKTLREAIDSLFARPATPNYRNGEWLLGLRRILGNFVDVCNTLEYAHSMQVIHRDIKPSNIMIGDYGETILVDWGLAKSIDEQSVDGSTRQGTVPESTELTQFGAAVGTPAYMSPEQADGGVRTPVGVASDIFSLGATLFHVLVGSPPVGDSDAAVSPSTMREAASQLSPLDRRPDVPKPLVSICRKAMALDPDHRYSGAKALATDIEAWMADQPVTAHQESRGERTLRWMRTHPTLVATSSVGCLLLLVACSAGFVLRSSFQAEIWREQQQASQAAQTYLNDLESSADAAETAAMIELRNSQYSAALQFLERAEELLADTPEFAQRVSDISGRRERIGRLVEFYHDLTRAEDLTFDEHSRRSTILFQRALQRVGVFQQLEWWNHLPDDELDASQRHQLREDVFRGLYLLAALRLKETLPSEYTIQAFLQFSGENSKEANAASIVLFDLMDGFRASQGAQLGREFAENRSQMLQRMVQGIVLRKKAIDWNAKSAIDSYVMGSALSFFCLELQPESRKPFEAVLGLVDAEATSIKMLSQSADLQPSHYFSQMMLGQTQRDHEQFDASYLRYTHAIAIRPNYASGYLSRGQIQLVETQSLKPNDPKRQILFRRAQRDIEKAIDINPSDWFSHKVLGDAISWTMEDTREVVPRYRKALSLAPPLDSLRDLGVEASTRVAIQSIRDWCKTVAEAASDQPEAAACAAWAALYLGDHDSAQNLLELAKQGQESTLQSTQEDYDHSVAKLVDGLLQLRAGNTADATDTLATLCRRAPKFFQAHAALGNCYESSGNYVQAHASHLIALELAEVDWHQMECYQALCRCAAALKRDECHQWIANAIALDSTDDLESLRVFLVAHDCVDVASMIDEHQDSLKPIQQLTNDTAPRRPALLNGNFELGLTEAWGDTLDKIDRPAWRRTGGSLAVASIVPAGVDSSAGLRISNLSGRADGRLAELSQTFPVRDATKYTLSFQMNVSSGDTGAVVVEVADTDSMEKPWCTIDSTDQADWQTYECQFTTTSQSATILIRCLNACDLIIDSIQLVAQD